MRLQTHISMLLILAVTAVAGAAPIPRQSLDAGWQFKLSNAPDAAQLPSDTAAWQSVDLPHDWSIAGPIAQAMRRLAGLEPDPAHPGYKHFYVRLALGSNVMSQ